MAALVSLGRGLAGCYVVMRAPDVLNGTPPTGIDGRNTIELLWPTDNGGYIKLPFSEVRSIMLWDSHNRPAVCPKLGPEHVNLTNWSRMRCHLCTQLFLSLDYFCCWVADEGWKRDKNPKQPPEAILAAARGMAPFVR